MNKRKVLFIISGIILISLGVNWSLYPYNAATFATVHEFSYGCLIQSAEFQETYGERWNNFEFCLHNGTLMSILTGMMAVGIILVYKGIKLVYKGIKRIDGLKD